MKNLIRENADVLGLNSITLSISFTAVEQVLQILLLLLSIVYTIDRLMYYRSKPKRKRKGVHSKNASKGQSGYKKKYRGQGR